MRFKIDIMSKDECILFSSKDLKDDCIIVSINDTGYDTMLHENKRIIDIHKVWFDDIENAINPKLKLMTIDQAEGIKDFVDKYKDEVKHIVIHCTAGISRSGAVGCVIARYLNDDDNNLWATGKYFPNKHVYKSMCKVFKLEFSDDMFKRKNKIRTRKEKEYNLKFYNDYGVNMDDMFCDVIIQ